MTDDTTAATRLDQTALDRTFDALAHARRRYLLVTLRGVDARPVSAAVDRVRAWEATGRLPALGRCEPAAPPGVAADATPTRDAVAVSVRHVHAPKLDGAGLVAYDPERARIARTDDTAAALSLLATGGLPARGGEP